MLKFPSLSTPTSPKPAQRHKRVLVQKLTSPVPLNLSVSDEEDMQVAARAAEARYGSSPGNIDFCKALKTSFTDTYAYFNPSLEKNLSRICLPIHSHTRLPSPQSSPQSPKSPIKGTPFRFHEVQHINSAYEHSAACLATNKLPLPGSPRFDTLVQSRKAGKRVASFYENVEKINAEMRVIMNILPKEESQPVDAEAEKQYIKQSSLTFYWSIRQATGSKPESREGASLVLLDRKFYLFGGQSMVKRNDTRVYNPDTGVWTMISTLYSPKGRIGHSLCPYKNQLFLFGGWSHYSVRLRLRRCFKKVYVLTLGEENKWQRYCCSGALPKSRRDHCMAFLGASMLIFGGIDGHCRVLKSARILDMETLVWSKLALKEASAKPKRRAGATLTACFPQLLAGRCDISINSALQGKPDCSLYPFAGFYLFGGLGDENDPLNDLWQLKVASGKLQWVELHPIGTAPTPRHSHSTVFLGQLLIVYGGRNDANVRATNGSLGDVVALRLEALRWDNVNIAGQVPESRWGHATVGLGSKMYVMGGLSYSNFQSAELAVLETDQGIATEYVHRDEEKEEKHRIKRKKTTY